MMPTQNIRYLSIIGLLLALLGCAPIDVVYQHDPSADFASLKTFNLLANQQKDISPAKLTMDRGDFNSALEKAFSSTLTAKGYSLNTENPDFVVTYFVNISTSRTVIPGKTYYRNVGYSYTGTLITDIHHTEETLVTYRLGTLIIDIFDARSKKSIWRGSAQTALDVVNGNEKKINRINKVVQKVLKKFPPD